MVPKENYMAKILEFPEDRCIQKNLHVAKETLKDMYDSIKMCYSTIEKLEEKIQETEHEYDVLFTQYVKARGLDNVELEYIQWVSGDIKINLETGEVSYESAFQEETEDPEPRGSA